jgi:hypothetical protein
MRCLVLARALEKRRYEAAFVILGPSYPHRDSLAGYLDGREGRFVLHADVECMAELGPCGNAQVKIYESLKN